MIMKQCLGKLVIAEKNKKQLWLAGPPAIVSMMQHCLEVISIMFVGHLGGTSRKVITDEAKKYDAALFRRNLHHVCWSAGFRGIGKWCNLVI